MEHLVHYTIVFSGIKCNYFINPSFRVVRISVKLRLLVMYIGKKKKILHFYNIFATN